MAREIDDESQLKDAKVLSELVVETVGQEDVCHHWLWHVQLLEGHDPRNGRLVLRSQARKIARRYQMRGGDSLHVLETRDNEFYFDLNAIELSINPMSNDKAVLAARHDIIVHPRGTGLGRVLMSSIIRRAKERFPDLAIAPARLGIADANTDEDRDRRNGFYDGHGFQCVFPDDPERRVGYVLARRIGDLIERVNDDKVSFLPPDQLLVDLLKEREKRVRAEERAHSLQASLDSLAKYCMSQMKKERLAWVTLTGGLLIWMLLH